MGHSVGEVVAACVAGVMTLDDALRLIAQRGRLMQSLPAGGAMAAVNAAEDRVAKALAPYRAQLAIAATNSPDQTVISGAAEAVQKLCAELAGQGVRCTPLTVSHAFHSPLVDPILDAFEREAASVHYSPPRVRLISNLTGSVADATALTRPDYWRRHVREAVRFGEGLKSLAALSPDCIIEIGPHPTLIGFASAVFGNTSPTLIPSLRKGRSDWEQMQDALASLYLAGAQINWRGVDGGCPRSIVDLPPYPFQRERYWFQAQRPVAATMRGRATGHPILGTRLRSAASQAIFESRVSADTPAYVRQHRVQDHVVMPATAYLDTLLCAARELLGIDRVCVENVTVQEAMLLDDDGASRSVQLVCEPQRDGLLAVTLSSAPDDDDPDVEDADSWVRHVTASLAAGELAATAGASLAELRAQCHQPLAVDEFYAGFARRGLDFGEGFRALRKLHVGEKQALGEVELAADLARDAGTYRMHPVLLDGCLQVLAAALAGESEELLYVPIGFGRYALHGQPGTRCFSHVVVQAGGGESRRANIRVFAEDACLLAELTDVQLKRVSRDALGRLLGERWLDEALFETRWQAATGSSAQHVSISSLVKAASDAVGDLRRSAELDAYDEFLPRLESLCADYVVQAMTRLGWQPQVGDKVDARALAQRLRIAPRHHRLFGRLLAILAEAGHLAGDAQALTVQRVLPSVDPATQLERLGAEFPCGLVELEFTGRVAAEFAEALRDEREPMELLFPGGSLDTAERLYRDTPTAQVLQRPDGRGNGGGGSAAGGQAAAYLGDRRGHRRHDGARGAAAGVFERGVHLHRHRPALRRQGERALRRPSVHALPGVRPGARTAGPGPGACVLRHRHRLERDPCDGRSAAHAHARSPTAGAGRRALNAGSHRAAALVRSHRRPHRGLVGL